VVFNLGVGQHVEVRTSDGKWTGRIHDVGERSYGIDTYEQVREVAYDETRAIKGTMPRERKVAIGVLIGIISAGVVLHLVHGTLCEC
jgi:hypothetical protein